MEPTVTITGMTTVFTPPASCSKSWTYEGSYYNSVSGGLLMQNLVQDDFNTACFPAGFEGYGRAPSSIQYFSPGACPLGYATPGAFNNAGTTTAICCPSSFSYYSTYSSINYFGSSSVLFQGCISTLRGSTTVSARSGNDQLVLTTITGPLTMWGQPVIVGYQQKDLSLFTTTSSTMSTSTSSKAATRSSQTSASASVTGSPSVGVARHTSSFPVWARVVTGIGVALGVLLLAGLAWFLIRRHRRRRTMPPGPLYSSGQPPMSQSGKPVVYEFYGGDDNTRQDIAGRPLHRHTPGEMDGASSANGSAKGTGSASGTVPGPHGGIVSWNKTPKSPIELE